jgi:hypothetical protein
MTTRRTAAAIPPAEVVDDGPLPAPVTGTEVDTGDTATIHPSVAEQNTAADRARGRTAIQAGIPGALIIIAEYLFALADVDLDPYSDGTGLPGAVAGAVGAILTVALAVRMNPKR